MFPANLPIPPASLRFSREPLGNHLLQQLVCRFCLGVVGTKGGFVDLQCLAQVTLGGGNVAERSHYHP